MHFHISKPKTTIKDGFVYKTCNFKLLNKPYILPKYTYVFEYKQGIVLSDLPIGEWINLFIDFIQNHITVIGGYVCLPFDDLYNMSNFVLYNNRIIPIDVIDNGYFFYKPFNIDAYKLDLFFGLNTYSIRYHYSRGENNYVVY